MAEREKEHFCSDCRQHFGNGGALARHRNSDRCKKERTTEEERKLLIHECEICQQKFQRADNLRKHLARFHEREIVQHFACGVCERIFRSREAVEQHRVSAHQFHNDFQLVASAHRRQTELMRAFIPADRAENINPENIDHVLLYCYRQLYDLAEEVRAEYNYFKMSCTLHVELGRYDEFGELTELKVFPFRSFALKVTRLMNPETLKEELARCVGDFERSIGEFLHCGSGWSVSRGMFIDVEIGQCQPLSGSVCNLHITKYCSRTSTVRPENFTAKKVDKEKVKASCFYQAIAAHFLPAHQYGDPALLADYALEHFTLGEKDPLLPVSVEEIDKFEADNEKLKISIAVLYKDEREEIIPVKEGKKDVEGGGAHCITLLLFFTDVEQEGGESSTHCLHYAYVNNPSSLLARRTRQVRIRNKKACKNYLFLSPFHFPLGDGETAD